MISGLLLLHSINPSKNNALQRRCCAHIEKGNFNRSSTINSNFECPLGKKAKPIPSTGGSMGASDSSPRRSKRSRTSTEKSSFPDVTDALIPQLNTDYIHLHRQYGFSRPSTGTQFIRSPRIPQKATSISYCSPQLNCCYTTHH